MSVRPAGWLASWLIVHMWQKLECCEFLGHYKYVKHQTLSGCTTHWALPIHTTSSDLDCISGSQQRQTVLTENVIFLLSWNFLWLLITSCRLSIYHYFWFLLMLKGHNWHISLFEKPLTLAFSQTSFNQDFSNFAGL